MVGRFEFPNRTKANSILSRHAVTPTASGARRDSRLCPSLFTMSAGLSAGLGIPVKLLHESLGHIVTVEPKTGHIYHGNLSEGGS